MNLDKISSQIVNEFTKNKAIYKIAVIICCPYMVIIQGL